MKTATIRIENQWTILNSSQVLLRNNKSFWFIICWRRNLWRIWNITFIFFSYCGCCHFHSCDIFMWKIYNVCIYEVQVGKLIFLMAQNFSENHIVRRWPHPPIIPFVWKWKQVSWNKTMKIFQAKKNTDYPRERPNCISNALFPFFILSFHSLGKVGKRQPFCWSNDVEPELWWLGWHLLGKEVWAS